MENVVKQFHSTNARFSNPLRVNAAIYSIMYKI